MGIIDVGWTQLVYFGQEGGVRGINNATGTRVKIVSQSFNNKLGILDVD